MIALSIAIALLLPAAPAPASYDQMTVVVLDSDGGPLPQARLALLALNDDGRECRVVHQTTAGEDGRAALPIPEPGLYLVAAELAGFLGSEMGPFRVEAKAAADPSSEAPATLSFFLPVACPICVQRPAVNEYLLARRCGARDPAQARSQ